MSRKRRGRWNVSSEPSAASNGWPRPGFIASGPFESLRPRLAQLGRLHASYGVLPAQYQFDCRSALGV